MSDILNSTITVEDPSAEKKRLGPWLAAWHDPVAGLECNSGCMQVRNDGPYVLGKGADRFVDLMSFHIINSKLIHNLSTIYRLYGTRRVARKQMQMIASTGTI